MKGREEEIKFKQGDLQGLLGRENMEKSTTLKRLNVCDTHCTGNVMPIFKCQIRLLLAAFCFIGSVHKKGNIRDLCLQSENKERRRSCAVSIHSFLFLQLPMQDSCF